MGSVITVLRDEPGNLHHRVVRRKHRCSAGSSLKKADIDFGSLDDVILPRLQTKLLESSALEDQCEEA
jgi:hypothetical protein